MIDIHCHLVPGIDDGARNMEEALQLLSIAEQDGIQKMVITPHLHLGTFDNTKEGIWTEFLALKHAAWQKRINIDLAVAAEIRIDAEIIALLEQDALPLLGAFNNSRYMLLELPHSHVPPGCEKLIAYLRNNNIIPLIAHPERNRDIQKSPHLIERFADQGCWFQITAASITGQFGETPKQLAVRFINEGHAHVVASDAHNVKRRPPILSEAKRIVTEHYGEDRAHELFYQNAFNISQSLFI